MAVNGTPGPTCLLVFPALLTKPGVTVCAPRLERCGSRLVRDQVHASSRSPMCYLPGVDRDVQATIEEVIMLIHYTASLTNTVVICFGGKAEGSTSRVS